jgi:pimeloyl-ACP methyl ester carboxylesterase
VVALTTVPYGVDLAWQLPLGSRVSWLTASAANPDPLHAPAKVFLLRGSGTVFSSGFGNLCTKLRRAGIWAEDLGPVGGSWICQHLIDEHQAGRLQGPIILVGHSRGGRHVLAAANGLQKAGISVDLLVCLDTALLPPVPGNVRQALNVYVSQQLLYPSDTLKPDSGATCQIENIDLNDSSSAINVRGLSHLKITASEEVHDFVMARILQVASQTRKP